MSQAEEKLEGSNDVRFKGVLFFDIVFFAPRRDLHCWRYLLGSFRKVYIDALYIGRE